MKNRLLTPKDIRDCTFTARTSKLTRREWYDAAEVDELLDNHVVPTVTALGHEAIRRMMARERANRHYIVVDENGKRIFETDSEKELNSRLKSLRRFKEELGRLIPKDFLKGTGFRHARRVGNAI